MIALDATRARMLEDIRASAALLQSSPCAPDTADAGAPEVRLLLRRGTPAEILPELNSFLARCCADIPVERLQRDLLSPLKKAVGNAHKRGNCCDPSKRITVEVVVTRAGVFFEVGDEGAGFDVPGTLALFRAGGDYFAHSGSGFRRFTKARSLISFDRGGSTLRLRFLRAEETSQATGGRR